MRRAQSHVLLTQPFSALVESTLIYQHSGLTVYLRWKQARIDALAEQLPHDRVLAHQPRGVRGRGVVALPAGLHRLGDEGRKA